MTTMPMWKGTPTESPVKDQEPGHEGHELVRLSGEVSAYDIHPVSCDEILQSANALVCRTCETVLASSTVIA